MVYAAQFSILAHFPGFGKSKEPSETFAVEQFSDALERQVISGLQVRADLPEQIIQIPCQ